MRPASRRATASQQNCAGGCSPRSTTSCTRRAAATSTTTRRPRPCQSRARSSRPTSWTRSSCPGTSTCSTSTSTTSTSQRPSGESGCSTRRFARTEGGSQRTWTSGSEGSNANCSERNEDRSTETKEREPEICPQMDTDVKTVVIPKRSSTFTNSLSVSFYLCESVDK